MGLKNYNNAQSSDRNVVEIRYKEARGNVLAGLSTAAVSVAPGDGFVYHLFETPGTFEVLSGVGNVEMLAIGAGGGRGGYDSGSQRGGAGGGGGSLGRFYLTPTSGVLSITIGGGGGEGTPGSGSGTEGPAGSNGGGAGGRAGTSGNSGGGGGGGGWTGISTGSTYYVVGGGGAGGGGAAEGPANDSPALGGGSPLNSYNPASLTGATGNNYPGDGGGYGGAGGGFDGSTGGGGNGGTTPISGGSNYVNPISLSSTLYAGGDGAVSSGPHNSGVAPAGPGAPGVQSLPGWNTLVPGDAGYGGGGGSSDDGQSGIVVIRHQDTAY